MSASTVSLLRFTGSDGSTTFTDEIGKVWTATNATISTTQSKFGGSRGYFNGSAQLYTATDASLNPLGNDWTIEYYFNNTTSTQYSCHFVKKSGSFNYGEFSILQNSSAGLGNIQVWCADYSVSGPLLSSSGSGYNNGQQHHIAVCRSGSNWYLFIDGAVAGTRVWAGSISSSSGNTTIGYDSDNPARGYVGYIDEFHVINGYAKYTENFLPPTQPVSRYTEFQHSRVILAMHADRKHGSAVAIDQSGTKKQFKFHGNARVTSAIKRVGRGSFAFDGAGDYLSATYKDFAFGRKPFTIELSYRVTSNPTVQVLFDTRPTATTTAGIALYLLNGAPSLYVGGVDVIQATAQTIGTWNHLAICRSGGITRMFLNGTKVGADYVDSNDYTSPTAVIGADYDGAFSVFGNLDEIVITDYAKYTTSFSVPPAPFARQAFALNVEPLFVGGSTFAEESGKAITNVGVTADAYNVPCSECYRHVSIVEFRNEAAGATKFYDKAGLPWTSYGVSVGTPYKDAAFNGSSYVCTPTGAHFNIGLSDFSLEFRLNLSTLATAYNHCVFSTLNDGSAGSTLAGYAVFVEKDTGKVYIDNWQSGVESYAMTTSGLSAGQTYTVAICSISGVVSIYFDGVAQTLSGSPLLGNLVAGHPSYAFVGVGKANGVDFYLNGSMEWLSLTVGRSNRTGNYSSPPLAEPPNYLGDNRYESMDVRVNEFGLTSGKFDGSSHVSLGSSTDFDLGTDDMTAEAWVYINGNASPDIDGNRGVAIIDTWPSSSVVGWSFQLYGTASATGTSIALDSWAGSGDGTQYICPAFISHGRWHHIAATVSGGVRRAFLNGKEVSGTTTNSGGGAAVLDSNGNGVRIGGSLNANHPRKLNGNIYGARLVKGLALYTSDFTPSTLPPDIPGAMFISFDEQSQFDTVNNDDNHEVAVYDITTRTGDKVFGLRSADLNGYSSRIEYGQSTDFLMTGDFRITTWIKPFQQAGAYPVIVAAANGAGAGHVETQFGYSNAAYSGMYSFQPYLNGAVSSIALTPEEWNYLELSRVNGTVRIFVNGVVGAAYGDGRWFDFSGSGLRIGGNTRDGANSYIKAMIADLEIVKDCGGHVANYIPPTRRMLFRESGRQGVYDFDINEAGTAWSLQDDQYARGPVTMVDGSLSGFDDSYDWIEDNGVYQTTGDVVHTGHMGLRGPLGYDGFIFGGNSSYINSPEIPAFEDLSGGYSIEFVMDPASKPYYANIINIGRGAGSGTHSGSIVIGTSDTNEASSSLSVQHYNGVATTPQLIAPLAYQSFGGLRYVIITHDPVTTARKIYINGALVAMDQVSLPDNDATRNRVLLGAWPADMSAKYTGFLSSVAIYDYALTDQQVDEASRIFLGQVKPVSVYENLMAQDVTDAINESVTIVFEAVSETVSATCSADAIVGVFYIYYETVAETLGLSTEAIYPREYFEAVYEAAMLTDSSTCLRVLLASIVEALVKTASASASKGFVETVNETVASSTSYLLSMIATVVEDVDLRDNLIGFAELIVAITESMSVTSSAVANRAVLAAVMESTEFSDDVTQNGLLQEMIREGFSMTLVQANGSEQWSGYAVNTSTMASSQYEGFKFNSYCKLGEDYYGASSTGIHKIGASETDNGEFINAIVTTGLINLGTSARKGFDNAFIIMRNDGDCSLRVLADGQEYSYKMMHERDGKFEGSRVKIGKGLRAVSWQFEIYNSDGADFDIDGAVIYPLVLSRHV